MSDHKKVKESLDDFVFNKNPSPVKFRQKENTNRFKRIFQPALSITFFTGLFIALGVYTFLLLKDGTSVSQSNHSPNNAVQSDKGNPSNITKFKNDRFNHLLSVLARFDLQIKDASEPSYQEFHGERRETITITTNLGDLVVTDFGRDIPPIIDSAKYAYTIYNHLLIGVSFMESGELVGITETIPKLDQVKDTNWTVTPTFKLPYKTNDGEDASYSLRGIKGKVAFLDGPIEENGVLKDTLLVAGKPNKFMWYFWGDEKEYSTPSFRVVAVHQKTGQIESPLVSADYKIWSMDSPRYNLFDKGVYYFPTSMVLSKPGKWALHVFVAGIYKATIVVNVRE